jgi:hypothetical protein
MPKIEFRCGRCKYDNDTDYGPAMRCNKCSDLHPDLPRSHFTELRPEISQDAAYALLDALKAARADSEGGDA